MSGWIALGLVIGLALLLLRLLGMRGSLLQMAGAALMFGAAGYAIQGQPNLIGVRADASQKPAPIALTRFRHGFFGNFTPTEHWLVISESYSSRGDTEQAAKVLTAAIREHPGDAMLWTGLGNALADHAGTLTPASELAFKRAAQLAPGHPAPPFFFGLALARSGNPEEGVKLWRAVLANAPANASWRSLIDGAIAAVQPQGQQPGQAGS